MFFKSRTETPAEAVEVEIFRPGTYKAMNGVEYTFSPEETQAIAEAFDPAIGPAPVVVGHPKHDAPAYAWASEVFMDDGILKARLTDVDPAFAEIVKAGRYKRISAKFFVPDASNNPAPGQYYLRHIGFLGAAAPAVKGLKSVEFVAEDECISFGEVDAEAVAERYERELEKLRQKAQADEAANEQNERKLRKLRHEKRVEDLIGEGRVLPWAKEGMVAFMAGLDDTESVAFADGEDEQTQVDWFFDYLAKQPAVVPLGETDMGAHDGVSDSPMFAAPEGYSVDRDGMKTHARAMRIMREKQVSFEDALGMIHGD